MPKFFETEEEEVVEANSAPAPDAFGGLSFPSPRATRTPQQIAQGAVPMGPPSARQPGNVAPSNDLAARKRVTGAMRNLMEERDLSVDKGVTTPSAVRRRSNRPLSDRGRSVRDSAIATVERELFPTPHGFRRLPLIQDEGSTRQMPTPLPEELTPERIDKGLGFLREDLQPTPARGENEQGEMSFTLEEADRLALDDKKAQNRAFEQMQFAATAGELATPRVDEEQIAKYEGEMERFLSDPEGARQRYEAAVAEGTMSPGELDELWNEAQSQQAEFERSLMEAGTRGHTQNIEERLAEIDRREPPHRQPPPEEAPSEEEASDAPTTATPSLDAVAGELDAEAQGQQTLPETPQETAAREARLEGKEQQNRQFTEQDEEARALRRYRIGQAIRAIGALGLGIAGAGGGQILAQGARDAQAQLAQGRQARRQQRREDAQRREQAAQRRQQQDIAERRHQETLGLQRQRLEMQQGADARTAEEFEETRRRNQPATDEQRQAFIASLPADLRERMTPAIMQPGYTVGQGEDLVARALRDTRYSRGGGGGRGGRGGGGGDGSNNNRSDTSQFGRDTGWENWGPDRVNLFQNLDHQEKLDFFLRGYRPADWFGPGSPARPASQDDVSSGQRTDARDLRNAAIRGLAGQQGVDRSTLQAVRVLDAQGVPASAVIGRRDQPYTYVWNGASPPSPQDRERLAGSIRSRNLLNRTMAQYAQNARTIESARPDLSDQAMARFLNSGETAETLGNWLIEQGIGSTQARVLAAARAEERNLRQSLVAAIREAENWGAQTIGEQQLAESQLPSTGYFSPQQEGSVSVQQVTGRARIVARGMDDRLGQFLRREPNRYSVAGNPQQQGRTMAQLETYIRDLQRRARDGDTQAAAELQGLRISGASGGGN